MPTIIRTSVTARYDPTSGKGLGRQDGELDRMVRRLLSQDLVIVREYLLGARSSVSSKEAVLYDLVGPEGYRQVGSPRTSSMRGYHRARAGGIVHQISIMSSWVVLGLAMIDKSHTNMRARLTCVDRVPPLSLEVEPHSFISR